MATTVSPVKKFKRNQKSVPIYLHNPGNLLPKRNNRLKALLMAITLFIALIARVAWINQYPVSLYWDEVAMGWNAYSILETGRDEYGQSFPLLFRSFNDYKLPGYIYTLVPFIWLFGLNEFSVRLPSALMGVATVWLLYVFVDQATKLLATQAKNKFEWRYLSLASAFFLAISPWHIHFSRAAYEANAALFVFALGSVLFIKNQKLSLLALSTFTLALSLYFYRSMLIVTPVWLLLLLFTLKTKLEKWKLSLLIVFFGVCTLPIYQNLSSDSGSARFNQVSIATDNFDRITSFAQAIDQHNNAWWARVVYNRRRIYLEEITQNYLSHFSPSFLFTLGDKFVRHSTPGFGQVYAWTGVLITLGVISTLKHSSRLKWLLLGLLLISPIPASVSTPAPHALRSLPMVLALSLLAGIGLMTLMKKGSNKLKGLILAVVLFASTWSSFSFGTSYVFGMNERATAWGGGYQPLIRQLETRWPDFDQVIVTGHHWQPYIYFLFYTNSSPQNFLKSGSPQAFGRYRFTGTAWDQGVDLLTVDLYELVKDKPNTLFALSVEEYALHKDMLKKISTIYAADSSVNFILAIIKPDYQPINK